MSHGVRVDGWDSNKKGLKAVEGRSPSQKYAKNEVNCDHEHSTIRSNSIQFHLEQGATHVEHETATRAMN